MSRKRTTPTRQERHALEYCPGAGMGYIGGESIDYTRGEVIEVAAAASGRGDRAPSGGSAGVRAVERGAARSWI